MTRPHSEWLTLTQACETLGIHPITLRAWIDQGTIQAFRTAGGHRRLRRAHVQEFLAQQQTTPPARALLPRPDQAVQEIRREISAEPVQHSVWYTQLSDAQRAQQRQIGQRLMGLLLQFVSRADNAQEFLEEGRALSRQYGKSLAKAGLKTADVARGFLFFCGAILQATYHPHSATAQGDADGLRLLGRINNFMDELLIATLEAYEAEAAPRAPMNKRAPTRTARRKLTQARRTR